MKLLASALFTVSLMLSGTASAQSSADPRIAAAQEEARAWFAEFDAGNVQGSWERGSDVLRNTVPPAEFQQRMASAQALGPLASRTLRGAGIELAPEQAPDKGPYVVLQYLSSYARRDNVVEKVYSKRDSEGIWRVANYLMY